MVYKTVKDMKLSNLGMGLMRLPTAADRGPIDAEAARKIVRYAYDHGVNYYDTAYRYHQGGSEAFVGSVMKEFPRHNWHLASKIPGHMMDWKDGRIVGIGYLAGFELTTIPDIFEEQLTKCGTDYFDVYMLHNLSEGSFDFYTNEEVGVVKYLERQKTLGRIRHLGFSSHGKAETIEKFLNWAGGLFEVAQIQLNYLDWTMQDAAAKYDVLTKHGVPVIAMEPVRGGRLAALGAEADAVLKAARPGDSVASWAFRFLQSLPNLCVALSGMSTLEQVVENVELFSSRYEPMSDGDKAVLSKTVSTVADIVPCTACGYCTDGCPKELDIPKMISMYNEGGYLPTHLRKPIDEAFEEGKRPSACIACGACARLCPQGIDAPGVISRLAAAAAQ